ncbi:biotin-dependent enzyme [Hoeflea marina]|uniref:Biotin-dependent enzyme n=1 Tax=Hoeflea marina TaxID=274592 RepID=A0A317PI19_9HYPH|nr:carboxyl transferase domain-containing protein [Hoeflea marina]PWV95776.1 biotin-dependent enzyme [Hoeflea marina]
MSHRKSLLIANRGEIAIRIAGAAASLGMRSVAVCSVDDQTSLHVLKADACVVLPGRGPAAYLDMEAVMAAAEAETCDMIHPGYGFLSENPDFARLCEDRGITFVGPSSEVLRLFGDKVSARTLAASLDVRIPLGTEGATTLEQARAFFASLGEGGVAMIKAVAGGGGRGMRVVRSAAELPEAHERCRSEAQAAFGNDAVYVEEFIASARHVEVQVLGDGSGNAVHFWDRECSLQRRHQKLVEIAPSLVVEPGLRQAILDAALRLARQTRYRGLATFEFLVETDTAPPRFHFMEANPRIQVEHTVTEEVTGHDLVEAQLRVAMGASLDDLGLVQDRIPEPRGYAIQLRVNMEQLQADGSVLPSGGVLSAFDLPSGPGIRVDSFGYTGYRTNPAFDSLLAKIIVRSRTGDFADAVARADRALSDTRIEGVKTNAGFLRQLLAQPEIRAGDFHTRFIETHLARILATDVSDARRPAALDREAGAAAPSGHAEIPPDLSPDALAIGAPMQGLVVRIDVGMGELVSAGSQIGIIEAMKMEMPVLTPLAGRVCHIGCAVGDSIELGAVMAYLDPEDDWMAGSVAVAAGDPAAIRPELAELLKRKDGLLDAARPEAVERRTRSGKRMVRENLAGFFDGGRYEEYGSLTYAAQKSRRSVEELLRISPADGLLAAVGQVNGDVFAEQAARCMALAYDYTVLAGTQGINSHHKKDRMLQLAEQWRIPVMLFAEGGGGRPGDTDYTGVSGLDSMTFRRLAKLNGLVPLVGVVTGRCFAGNAALLGCCDVIIATRDSNIGMAGPAMIEGGGLGVFRPEEVGPTSVQGPNGVIDVLVEDEAEAVAAARRYLGYFQGTLPEWTAPDQTALRQVVPENRLRAYEVRKVIELLADEGTTMELRRGFAPSLVTTLIRIEGRAIGVIANNSLALGGAIDADCADKATRFMQVCEAFGLPIVTLCDTPGFMVGPRAEETALVRHVSRMFVTAAALTVPMVTIVLRKAYGLGAMAMAGGSFHAPAASLSWPTGEFGGMGLEGAVRLAYRADLAAAAEGEQRDALFRKLVDQMYQKGKALNVASTLEIDDVIDPAETRSRIRSVLSAAGVGRAPRTGSRIDTW